MTGATWRLAVLMMLGVTPLALHAQGRTIPAEAFPRPTGPYAVGTLDTVWVDSSRAETLTKTPNDKRHVPVRIWYPAAATGQAPARYVQRPEEFGSPSPFAEVLHVTTHAVSGAPIAAGNTRYPVLLYNPGGGWNRFTATFQVEQLASLGYVVVSVDHLGFNQSSALANGYHFKGDTLGFPEPSNTDVRGDALASWDYLERVLFPIWVADAQFVLDRIGALQRDAASPLRGRLDLGRIGAFGWSFGGATSVDLLVRDARIKAAIDQDGQLFGLGRVKGSARPVMLMHSTDDPRKTVPESQHGILAELLATVEGWDEKFRSTSTHDVYDLRIAGTAHGHFSDLTLFFPQDSTALAPRRAHEIITAYTVAFFDQYLKGETSTLLKSEGAGFPEATLVRKSTKR